jgi:hypothetical protein
MSTPTQGILGYSGVVVKHPPTMPEVLGTTTLKQERKNGSRKTLVTPGIRVAEKRGLGQLTVCLGSIIQIQEKGNYLLRTLDLLGLTTVPLGSPTVGLKEFPEHIAEDGNVILSIC